MAARKAAPDAQPPRLSHGFTLVEIALVLGIVALMLGALLPLLTAQTANSRISATRAHQDTVRAALITYVGRHGYLPCPADGFLGPAAANYGHEARSPFNGLPAPLCDGLTAASDPIGVRTDNSTGNWAIPSVVIYRGVLPWRDLGLPEEIANDGWNQRISYVVTSLAVSGYATREAVGGMLGGLVVCNAAPGAGSTAALLTPIPGLAIDPCPAPTGASLVSGLSAAAVLISHGQNGFGAFVPPQNAAATASGPVKPWKNGLASDAEVANIDLGKYVLVQAPYSKSFDDVVLWLTPADLTTPLIQSGALPAPQALMSARFAAAREAILASIVNTARNVSGSVNGTPFQGEEYFLCLPLQDASLNPLFYTWYSGSVGGQLNVNALPAAANALDAYKNWGFSYEGSADLAQDNTPVRDPAKAAQVNYDPWGNPLLFTQTLTDTGVAQTQPLSLNDPNPSSPTRPYAYVLYSLGPDGIAGTADDSSVGVTVSELQNSLQRGAQPLVPSGVPVTPSPCPPISGAKGG